jgi:radical SAM superfamily enzyme YgiQ (UPF0313 family)
MKILLIYPRPILHKPPVPSFVPLSLSFIASPLKEKGHRLSIFDRFAIQARRGIRKETIDSALIEHLQTFQPDLVGLNTVSPLIDDTVHCASLIRENFQGVLIAGGHHVTALPELSLQKIPELDGVIEGEAEMALRALAEGDAPASIPGVWWKKPDGTVVHTPPRSMENLDALPFPALDLLDMDFYTRPTQHALRGHFLSVASILSSRGCPRRCDFCTESLTYGRKVRFHSPDYVAEWIRQILAEYPGVEGIYFHDNDFLIDEDRARRICETFLTTGLSQRIKWGVQARVDRVHPEILRLMKKAGCISVEFGVESSLQSRLDEVHKGTTAALNQRAIRLCREAGLSAHVYMITGFKGEQASDLEQNLRWIKEVRPNTFYWFRLEIHPGTVLYQREGNRFFEENDWSEEKVTGYYRQDTLSRIPPGERLKWMKEHYQPYHRWHRWMNLARVNPIRKLIILLLNGLKTVMFQAKDKNHLTRG